MPIVLHLARRDEETTTWTGGAQDNGPPTVRVYNRWGRHVCSCYWLIVRNRMFGLAKFLFGREPGDDWWEERTYGPIYVGWSYGKYRATPQAHWLNGPFVSVGKFTVRLR